MSVIVPEKGPTKLNSEIFANCGVLARVYLGGSYDGSTVVGTKFFTGATALTAIPGITMLDTSLPINASA